MPSDGLKGSLYKLVDVSLCLSCVGVVFKLLVIGNPKGHCTDVDCFASF